MAEYDFRSHNGRLTHIPTRIDMLIEDANNLAFNQGRDDEAHSKLDEAKRLEDYMQENNTEYEPRF